MAYSRKHSKKHSKKHAKRGGSAHVCPMNGGRKLSKKHSKKHSKRGGGHCDGLAGGRKHKTRRGGKSMMSKSMLAKASGLLKTAAVPFGLVLANSAMKKRMSRKSRSRR